MSEIPCSEGARFDFEQFPLLETERIVLREIVPSDTDAIFRIRGDYEVTRYNIGDAYADRDEATDLIGSMRQAYRERRELRWGLTLKADPNAGVVGMCGFNDWYQTDRRGSIGFDLARAYWRRGLMREAVKALIGFGFARMHLNRIEADASLENTASVRLLESLGFVHEGTQRDQYFYEDAFHDLALFGLLRCDWESR